MWKNRSALGTDLRQQVAPCNIVYVNFEDARLYPLA
jgi:hypothetical protein